MGIFIKFLGVVLLALLLGCSHVASENKRINLSATKTLKSPWKSSQNKVTLYQGGALSKQNGQVLVDAKRAVYEVSEPRKLPEPILAKCIAFVNSETGHQYIGEECDFYVEMDEEIYGFSLAASFLWRKPSQLRASSGEDVGQLIHRFEATISEVDFLKDLYFAGGNAGGKGELDSAYMELSKNIPTGTLFAARPGSSIIGTPAIAGVESNKEILKLELRSMTGDYVANFWINLNTRTTLKVLLNDKMVLP